MNSPASDPQGFGHKADSSIPQRVGFRSSPTPPRALIEQRGQGCVFASNECHLFFPRHAANLLAVSFLFKLFFLEALAGCQAWLVEGRLTTPPAVKTATEGYRNEMDAVGRFLEERCILRLEITTPSGDLYAAYTTWCEANGEKPLTQMSFANRLK